MAILYDGCISYIHISAKTGEDSCHRLGKHSDIILLADIIYYIVYLYKRPYMQCEILRYNCI